MNIHIFSSIFKDILNSINYSETLFLFFGVNAEHCLEFGAFDSAAKDIVVILPSYVQLRACEGAPASFTPKDGGRGARMHTVQRGVQVGVYARVGVYV